MNMEGLNISGLKDVVDAIAKFLKALVEFCLAFLGIKYGATAVDAE